jgi:hypothetical protein
MHLLWHAAEHGSQTQPILASLHFVRFNRILEEHPLKIALNVCNRTNQLYEIK